MCKKIKTFVSFRVIGNNIREARNKKHMTQDQVAEKLNISQLHYNRLERGERRASLEQIVQIARTLDVSVAALLDGSMDIERFDAVPPDPGFR